MNLRRYFPSLFRPTLSTTLLAAVAGAQSDANVGALAATRASTRTVDSAPAVAPRTLAAAGSVEPVGVPPALVAAVTQIFGGGCLPVYPTDGFILTPGQWNSIPVSGEGGCGSGSDCETAWNNVEDWSDEYSTRDTTPDLTDITMNEDVICWANAVRWRATGTSTYRDQVWDMLEEAMTYTPGATSANGPGRNMLSYVLAADAIELRTWDVDGLGTYDENAAFKTWIDDVHDNLWGNFDGCNGLTLRGCAKDRPQNIGFFCGASVIAIEMYLQHDSHLCDLAEYFKGVTGNRTAYAGFDYGSDTSWQSDTSNPRPINPQGATIGTTNVDGVIPDDMRRIDGCGSCTSPTFSTPGCAGLNTNYVWEALQGIVMSAHLLDRMSNNSFGWQNDAVGRAVDWLYSVRGFPPEASCQTGTGTGCAACDGGSESDDTWVSHITQAHYATSYTLLYGGKPGKNCGFADWWAAGIP